jgi:hypothetical protein
MRARFVVIILLLLMAFPILAQPGDPSSDPDAVPITGLELLIGAGALLGVKRIYSRNKEKQ